MKAAARISVSAQPVTANYLESQFLTLTLFLWEREG
jgi:hypothetical protein